jgi:hypothetical protein
MFAPHAKILILEKHKKKWLGGRTSNEEFHGVNVVTGAGIGRKNKDYLLIHLLKELKIPFHEFHTETQYASTIQPPCDVKKIFLFLKKEYNKHKNQSRITFKNFAMPLLGKEGYQHFLTCAGYSDYENEDAYDTLYNYGFDDNYSDYIGLSIPWKQLVETLARKIGIKNIRFSSDVVKIEKKHFSESSCFALYTETGATYFCEKVIVATTISSIMKLVPGASNKNSIYQQIHGQPFLRVYGKFSKSSIPIMKKYVPITTIVPGPLYKIIPMDADKGVYMIAYSDNNGALALKDHLTNIPENRTYFSRLLETALGIPENALRITSMLEFYWPIGTHYYSPLKGNFKNRSEFINEAQHPEPGMLVVGEVVSSNQGWTEGAIDSVQKVVTNMWVKSHYY